MKKILDMIPKRVVFLCMSCGSDFLSWGVFPEDGWEEKITNCSYCCPFYAGSSAGEIKVGSVEKFRERAKKTKKIIDNKKV